MSSCFPPDDSVGRGSGGEPGAARAGLRSPEECHTPPGPAAVAVAGPAP